MSTDWVSDLNWISTVEKWAIGLLTLVPARQGCTVVIPFREEMAKRHLKVTGDLGRVVFIVGLNYTPYCQKRSSNLVLRSTTFEIPLLSRPACDTQMLFST